MTDGHSGARHKGFYTREDAEDWLADNRPPSAKHDTVSQPRFVAKSEPGEDDGLGEMLNRLKLDVTVQVTADGGARSASS